MDPRIARAERAQRVGDELGEGRLGDEAEARRADGDAQLGARGQSRSGSIFMGGGRSIGLFEDNRPRNVGDILTIVIAERMNATKTSGANASREVARDLRGRS